MKKLSAALGGFLKCLYFRAVEILKYARPTPDFYLVSRHVRGSILKYVPIDVTQKTDKKTGWMVHFIVSMALITSKMSNMSVLTKIPSGDIFLLNDYPILKESPEFELVLFKGASWTDFRMSLVLHSLRSLLFCLLLQ